ncbi:AAA family ATPase [[Mycobacterium] nativiensis]|uniref:AAA family ATPase n=1 Tax=[Mycobacterium] nativiensis TaxID=2855503 RepID=A0ABU5XVW5_9MYCO|nr:AAA family ATPase [Mycolicibacter sp. MYC340]MEB3032088.1 AAA family ATPase [Mycolicibacter sp. MYC340]
MKLPAFEDLSKEQDLIYNLDLDGNYLVSGPPGTGKSVMALYRAQALTFDDREPAVLMYSNVLKQYTEQAANEVDVAGLVTTFHSWFWHFWKTHYRTAPPKLPGSRWDHDWAQILQQFVAKPPELGKLADLIVDEGQDLSLRFFQIARMMAKNITVFADENQQLHDHNTTLDEIEKGIGATEHLTLRRNYRNTAEIAAVAARYYVGAPTGVPDPPDRHGDKPTLRNYGNVGEFVDFVARYVKGRTNLTIGIACPNQKRQRQLFRELESRKLPVPVQMYVSTNPAHKQLTFELPAVTLVHYKSLKGLEFDTLFVPELQEVTMDPTSAVAQMMFYVVMSRARDELHLSWSGSSEMPAILAGLKGLVQKK